VTSARFAKPTGRNVAGWDARGDCTGAFDGLLRRRLRLPKPYRCWAVLAVPLLRSDAGVYGPLTVACGKCTIPLRAFCYGGEHLRFGFAVAGRGDFLLVLVEPGYVRQTAFAAMPFRLLSITSYLLFYSPVSRSKRVATTFLVGANGGFLQPGRTLLPYTGSRAAAAMALPSLCPLSERTNWHLLRWLYKRMWLLFCCRFVA